MKRIFTDFSTNNKYALNLNIYLRDIYNKFLKDPKTTKNYNDNNINLTFYPNQFNTTNYIM
jgi:hypothetical protein